MGAQEIRAPGSIRCAGRGEYIRSTTVGTKMAAPECRLNQGMLLGGDIEMALCAPSFCLTETVFIGIL